MVRQLRGKYGGPNTQELANTTNFATVLSNSLQTKLHFKTNLIIWMIQPQLFQRFLNELNPEDLVLFASAELVKLAVLD